MFFTITPHTALNEHFFPDNVKALHILGFHKRLLGTESITCIGLFFDIQVFSSAFYQEYVPFLLAFFTIFQFLDTRKQSS
jgi:hypothetical protein